MEKETTIKDTYKKSREGTIVRFKERMKEQQKDNIYYLSVVAIVKNEALYIEEWLDYHISMGVEHFYIYDNESTDNLKEILQAYIDKGYVSYTFWEGKLQQIFAYNHSLQCRTKTRWLAIIDIDEFICPQEKISIPEILKDYEDYPALAINQIMFDSNGHNTKPEGSVLENYTRIHKDLQNVQNQHVKCIVNPLWVDRLLIHNHRYKLNQASITENYEELFQIGTTEKVSIDKIRINHYFTKSREEYHIKVDRGLADRDFKYTVKEEHVNFPETTNDYTILQHVDKD